MPRLREALRWLALIASAILPAVRLYQSLLLSPLPPGLNAPYVYASTIELSRGSLIPDSFSAFSAVSLALGFALGDLDRSIRVVALASASAVPLAIYALARSLLRREWLAVVAALAAAVCPAVDHAALSGTYGALIAVVTGAAILSLALGSGPLDKARFLALIALSSLSPLVSLWLPPCLAASILVAMALCWREDRRRGVALLAVFVVLLSTLLVVGSWRAWDWRSPSYPLLRPPALAELVGGFIPLFLLALALLCSIATAAYRRRFGELTRQVAAFAPALAFSAVAWEAGYLACLASLPAAIAPLELAREAASLSRRVEGGEPVVEIEVSLDKALAVVLSALLVVSLVPSLAVPYSSAFYLSETTVKELRRVADWLKANLTVKGVVAAPPEVIKWLEVLSGLDLVPEEDAELYRAIDAVVSTSFRMEGPSIRVDEWEPLSTARAPRVCAWDGRRYVPLLYIDDSYVRVTLLYKGRSFVESPYKSMVLFHELRREEDRGVLELGFETHGLFINKTVEASLSGAGVRVVYCVRAKEGRELKRISLPVWVDFGAVFQGASRRGESVVLRISGFEIEVRYLFSPRAVRIVKRAHPHVEAVYEVSGSSAMVGVEIVVRNSAGGGPSPWAGWLKDLARKYRITHIVAPRAGQFQPVRAMPLEAEAVSVIDAFVRILIESWGKEWIEAPSSALVLNETVKGVGAEWVRAVRYRTAGLLIDKVAVASEEGVELTYRVRPHKERTFLKLARVSVWVAWERILRSWEARGSEVKLVLDACNVTVGFRGRVTDLKVDRHPIYGQLRVYAELKLEPEEDEFSIYIRSPTAVKAVYVPTTRPEMEASDVVRVYVVRGFLEPLYRSETFEVFRVIP